MSPLYLIGLSVSTAKRSSRVSGVILYFSLKHQFTSIPARPLKKGSRARPTMSQVLSPV